MTGMRWLPALALGCIAWAQPVTERGEINAVPFRIDIPASWNKGLVMFCHGYTAKPVTYPEGPVHKSIQPLLDAGYAVAQSAFAGSGWAIDEGAHDTEALRRYFVRKYGTPRETYISGGSMGGFLTIAILEKFPALYDGGLALCGPLDSSAEFIQRRGFDLRVVFDYYLPGVLPDVGKVPEDFQPGPELIKKIMAVLDARPKEAAELRAFSRLRLNAEVAWAAVLFTDIMRDVQRRGEGNPFDNTNTIYEGTSDDNALNDGVRRYRADPAAAAWLRGHYTPTGRISRPLVALHTTYDPLVPPWVANAYALTTAQAGTDSLFVQQYVHRATHCGFTADEIRRSFDALRAWKEAGRRPQPGVVGNVKPAETQ